jgi:4-hydroxybutyrate dehydrogenase/sulfolactaldehyde 3-reductase
MSKVCFIGLGTMGFPMARNLLKGGHELCVFDINADAVTKFADLGGQPFKSPLDAAQGADFVITMLPNAPHVRTALFEEGGAVHAMRPDALFIDMSTIHPLESDAIAAGLTQKKIKMVDAPVGRGSVQAEQGKLLIMAGGDAADVERARPLFERMGDTIIHCGPRGSGARIKVINNFMSASLCVLTAETLMLAESAGVDVKMAIKVMMCTPAGQGQLNTNYAAKVLAGDVTPGFMIDLAHKDLGLGLDFGSAMKVPLPMGAVARESYSLARARGYGRKDWTAIYDLLRSVAKEAAHPQ